MKKTLLALAVISAASSVNAAEILKTDEGSVDFYGQLRTRVDFADSNDYAAELTTGSSRLGLDAAYAVNDSVKALGKVEFGVPANKSNDVEVRVHMVGFATDYGTLRFGRDWTTSDDIGGTDYSYVYGGSTNAYSLLNGALHKSQAKYSLELDNFWVKASYGFADGADSSHDLAEAFVGTSFGPVSVHTGGGRDKVGAIENKYYEVTAVLAAADNLELSATYYGAKLENTEGAGSIDQNGISVGAYWTVVEKTSIYGGYEWKNQDATDVLGDADEDYTNIFAGVEYKFASWARVFAEANYADGATLGYKDAAEGTVERGDYDAEFNYSLGMRVYW
ncbi:porin [Vibrio fluvialis]|uniref:porin n=1 Tax=Vibrio fluvialis TaxID=676 RepID=UPI00096B8C4B|nr:porin [Vibrio fluvialis]EKO3371414.1 porin [Vibrio fluvialis]EKO3439029.1 porin [Vibrio fluvialis]EKO3945315.1 porin [Vibrio fluvialis]EKO3973942.1 porin [Vibrio fluvialis]ELE5025890.1 porin [Vibrio fluvialis]